MMNKPNQPPAPDPSALPTPSPPNRLDPQGDVVRADNATPRIVCTLGRGWLKGWKEVGLYCGFASGKGTGASRTGRRWERDYALPVHRLPSGEIRAIPYELDQWLITFTEMWKEAGYGYGQAGDQRDCPEEFKRNWGKGFANNTGEGTPGV